MKHAIALILICGLLLGCIGGTPESSANRTPVGQDGNANMTEPNVTQDSGGGAITQPPAEKTYSATFSELAGMGIPLECSINYTYSGRQVNALLFFGKESEIRVESPEGVSQCDKTITVIRDTRQYVGCSDKDIVIGCDWFKSAYDTDTPGLASSFDFGSVPASSISCRGWEYDQSMFMTSGTACEMG